MINYKETIEKMLAQGYCAPEIADLLHIDSNSVRHKIKYYGLVYTDAAKQRGREIGRKRAIEKLYGTEEDRKNKSEDFIKKYHPGFVYVSGTISSDDMMQIKCTSCGTIINKSAITIRRKCVDLICPICEEKRKQGIEEEKAREKDSKQKQQEKEKVNKFWEQPFEQMAVLFCPICNTAFIGRSGKKYCSAKCREKAHYKYHKDKRIVKIHNRCVDKDIDIKKLFKRDCGICWLCGLKCDFDDFEIINGYFVVGKNYPSIDHVFPLSKGGLHSWNNVKLAHHYCNTKKRDKVVGL